MVISALLLIVFLTSLLSGVFGMAGGLVLMGAFTALMPVSAAMVTHGGVQLIANGWRAVLHRRFIRWRIIALYLIGSVSIAALLLAASYAPSKAWVFLLLGLTPITTWLPRSWLQLDAARTPQAIACGALVTGFNIIAGAAGPLLDIFFVRTELDRHTIVATKAATQSFSHIAKITFYGAPLLAMRGQTGLPPAWFFLSMVPLSMAGTWAGGYILARLTDVGFKAATRLIVTFIGATYLVNAARLFLHV